MLFAAPSTCTPLAANQAGPPVADARRTRCLPATQILETKVDSAELVSSFATLSEVHTVNTPATRRRLRSTIEHRGLAIAQGFLADAGVVVDALNAVRKELDGLTGACDGISKGLQKSKVRARALPTRQRGPCCSLKGDPLR